MCLIYSVLWRLLVVGKAKLVPVTKPLHVPCTPHTAPILSTEQSATRSATSPRAAEGVADGAPPTTDVVEEGVDAGLYRDVEAFLDLLV